MCGIAGYLQNERPLQAEMLAHRMCNQIIHRGPDDEGIYLKNGLFLGMRRLAIIDPALGKQPLTGANDQVVLVFNGEIYNYRELRRELITFGAVFETDSDTEVVLQAYLQWGEDCFSRFNGMFAIALWDERSASLILARDRLGKKPLFYQHSEQGLIFGSELKSLLCHPAFERELCQEALREYMLLGYVHYDRSIFKHCRKLPPAHYLVLQNGKSREECYWTLGFDAKSNAKEPELLEELRETVRDAVALRLRSDVDFGAFLSGGIDSSIVVGMMAEQMSRPVKAFSIGFEEAAYNELDDARMMAEHVGADFRQEIVSATAIEHLDKLIWHLDEPMADSSALPTYLVSRLAAREVKMVLSGDGGDEGFAGYERYRRYQILQRVPAFGAQALRGAARLVPGATGLRMKAWGERLSQSFPESYLSGVALSTPSYADTLLGLARRSDYGNVSSRFAGGRKIGLDAVLAGDIQSYLLDDILVKVDRMSMANSLECRSPLLDYRVLEFSARLPMQYKMRGGQSKYLLRKLAAEYLPAPLMNKAKQGFALPVAEWFRGELAEMMQDLLSSQAMCERGIFDMKQAQQSFKEHQAGLVDHSEHLWQMLCFERWAQTFLDASWHGSEAEQ
jgi:asparagine synthase (glutamine-hydrolysing)